GIFVATDFDGAEVNQKLDVEFKLSGKHDLRSQWMSTILVRKSAQGLALERDDGDGARSETVSNLLFWLRSTNLPDSEGPGKMQTGEDGPRADSARYRTPLYQLRPATGFPNRIGLPNR